MTRMLLAIAILASACAGSSAAKRPEGSRPSQAGAQEKLAAGDPNELVCENERDTGSHIVEKICRTRWQIDEERRETQRVLGEPLSTPFPPDPGAKGGGR